MRSTFAFTRRGGGDHVAPAEVAVAARVTAEDVSSLIVAVAAVRAAKCESTRKVFAMVFTDAGEG